MATKKGTEAGKPQATELRKSRTIFVTDSEWQEITEAAEAQGRKPSRHLVLVNRETAKVK